MKLIMKLNIKSFFVFVLIQFFFFFQHCIHYSSSKSYLNFTLSCYSSDLNNYIYDQFFIQCLWKRDFGDWQKNCDHCKKWVYHKCNELSSCDIRYIQNNKDFWDCINCIPQNFQLCTNKLSKANIILKHLPKSAVAWLNLIT